MQRTWWPGTLLRGAFRAAARSEADTPAGYDSRVKRPTRMFRVEFMQGFGYPDCVHRSETKRNFEDAGDAARLVADIQAMPSHHVLLGVYETRVMWEGVPPGVLPDVDPSEANRRMGELIANLREQSDREVEA